MEQILHGTGWAVERYIETSDSMLTYIAILEKVAKENSIHSGERLVKRHQIQR